MLLRRQMQLLAPNSLARCKARAWCLGAQRRTAWRAPAGLAPLLSYYSGLYFEAEGADAQVPRPVTFPDVSEYLVAQAVVTALAACRAADGSSDFSVIDLLLVATQSYVSAWDPYDDSGLLAALCHGLGELRITKVRASSGPQRCWLRTRSAAAACLRVGRRPSRCCLQVEVSDEVAGGIYGSVFAELERHLNRDLVAPSPGCIVGIACVTAMTSLASSGRCRRETLER